MPVRRAIADGNWSSPSTWEGGQVPQSGDSVVITTGVSVTFDIASFSGADLTLEPYSFLLFPTTAAERTMTWSGNITLQAHATVDIVNGNTLGSEFIQINCVALNLDETANWFGSLRLSPRRNNLAWGEWGLTVANAVPSGATQVTLSPANFYNINPNLVTFLAGKSLYIALDGSLVVRTVLSASWDSNNNILTVTVSTALPAIPAGVSALFLPDPFSTHVSLQVTSVNLPTVSLAAHTVKVANDPNLTIFGDGLIVFDTVARKVSGRNIWFNDFRSNPVAKVSVVQANAVAVCDLTAITYDISARRIGFEGIFNGFSGSPLIISDILKIKRNHALSGSGFTVSAKTFSGYLRLSGSSFAFEAQQAYITQLSWNASFDPSNCQIIIGSTNFSSSLASDFDWFAFLSFLAEYNGNGLIELHNFGKLYLLRANYKGREFIIYHEDLRPLKIDMPMTLRHAQVRWGKAEQSFTKFGEDGKVIAWGAIWEKDFRNVDAEPPTCEATLTGNVVTMQPARPNFEVLEGIGDNAIITLPSANSGRFWLFNEGAAEEPWIYLTDEGYVGFHTPATSATLSQLRLIVTKTERERALGWRWHAAYPNDLAEIRHFVSRYDPNYYAAVFLILSHKGWNCYAVLWSLDANTTPVRKTLTYPSLTVLSPQNLALGVTCHAFIRKNTELRRLSFQANLFDQWNDYPVPSPIPVTVKSTNFAPTNVTLNLNEEIPRLAFYDDVQERTLLLDQVFTEYEKITLKSLSEVIEMFAANLKARLVLTGTATSGSYKSEPTEKFAVTCIVVTGRGTVYFWDWVSGTRNPSDPNDLAQTKLVIEVNANAPTVVAFTPIMFPMGLYIEARKASADPFLGVYVYSD